MSRRTLVLCGNGASAVLLVCALARQAGLGLSIVIIGKKAEAGHGIAYSTRNPNHLLNVPATRMSADINRPDQFVQWLATRGIATQDWAHSFVSRSLYGDYLSELLDTTLKSNPDLEVRFIQGEVKSLMKKHLGWIVAHEGGAVNADLVALATGNDLPPPIGAHHAPKLAARISDDPWAEHALENNRDVLILGSGLTAIDVAISLKDRGHTGKIHLLSRHGLLPQSHVEPEPASPLAQPFPETARGFLRAMRTRLGSTPSAAQWQGLMDAMRPHWPQIWLSFPTAEKKRFLRHCVTQWNIHRHRLAPAVGEYLRHGLGDNMHVKKGRLRHLRPGKNGMIAVIAHGEHVIDLPVNHVINCTGPNPNPEKTHDHLIENLVASRLARGTDAGVGLDVDARNRVLDKSGVAQPSLLAMGALTRGHWWEITAIPEIAHQAQVMSGAIMEYLGVLNAASRVNRHR
ncbi:MAG: FAD/NAD(P)-binding protein [Pseudomonadota bacterium]